MLKHLLLNASTRMHHYACVTYIYVDETFNVQKVLTDSCRIINYEKLGARAYILQLGNNHKLRTYATYTYVQLIS